MYRGATRLLSKRPNQKFRYFSGLSGKEREGVSSWLTEKTGALPIQQPTLVDYLNPSQIKALACTLPSLDGSIPIPDSRHFGIEKGSLLAPGHLLVFCNPSVPERDLDSDATTPFFPPPPPFVRRMWASGKFTFQKSLRLGNDIRAERKVTKIDPKRLDSKNPMIIVEQTIATKPEEEDSGGDWLQDAHTIETRSHVYMPLSNERRVRAVTNLPVHDFSFSYKPTGTTLFRFSALTFNGHQIHLDKEYSQNIEGLPERLVHGPMTAAMLLEIAECYRSERQRILSFDYRATNQLFINNQITIYGTLPKDNQMTLWAQSDGGVVGMVGEITLTNVDSSWA